MGFEKIQIFEQLPKSKIPLLAIHKIISHDFEEGPPFGEHLSGNMVTFDTFWEPFRDSLAK